MTGVASQTAVERGAVNFDGTNLFIGSGSSPVNQIAYVAAHSLFTPMTGATITLLNNQRNIVNPSGAIAALTITLPASPANNDVVFVKFTQAVTTVTYSGGTVVDGIVSPSAGGLITLTSAILSPFR
jgi:hypothetical protein